MHSHNQIRKLLEKKQSFVDDMGPVCVQAIDQHSLLLSAHRQRLVKSHDLQVRLRDEVTQSIMSGVNVLISSENKKLANTHLCHFHILYNDGVNLFSTNDRITIRVAFGDCPAVGPLRHAVVPPPCCGPCR